MSTKITHTHYYNVSCVNSDYRISTWQDDRYHRFEHVSRSSISRFQRTLNDCKHVSFQNVIFVALGTVTSIKVCQFKKGL